MIQNVSDEDSAYEWWYIVTVQLGHYMVDNVDITK